MYLGAAAWKVGSQADVRALGYIKSLDFNVEDILVLGLLLISGLKVLGDYVVENI
jgi:hypothetical protein